FSGHATGPVKGLYYELRRKLGQKVWLIDEYQTSIVCSKCNKRWMNHHDIDNSKDNGDSLEQFRRSRQEEQRP
ncbi:36029_t:CDS:2, partial [Racocetra persica]